MTKFLATAILFWVNAAFLSAQQHPNFSGTWNLDLGVSDYSDRDANKPDRMAIIIEQKSNVFKYRLEREQDGKKGSAELELTIGKELESDAAGVVDSRWNGDKLEIRTMYNPGQDRQSDRIEVWSLSADGKQLTDDMLIHPPNHAREVHVRRIFNKKG